MSKGPIQLEVVLNVPKKETKQLEEIIRESKDNKFEAKESWDSNLKPTPKQSKVNHEVWLHQNYDFVIHDCFIGINV